MSAPVGDALQIDLLRHGEPVGGHRYRGDGVDDPLSETGWRQMWAAVEGQSAWQGVVSSPLQRSRAFAETLAARLGLPCKVDARLREIGMGSWDGLTREEARAADPQAFDRYYSDPQAGRPPGAESLDSLRIRVSAALDDLCGNGSLLVVAHAVVIRAAIAHAVEGSTRAMMRIPVPYAGMTRLRRDARGWMLVRHRGE